MIQIKFIEHLLHALGIQEGTRQAQILPVTRPTSGQGSQAGLGGGVARRERAGISADAIEGRVPLREAGLIFWGIFQGLRTHLSAVPPESLASLLVTGVSRWVDICLQFGEKGKKIYSASQQSLEEKHLGAGSGGPAMRHPVGSWTLPCFYTGERPSPSLHLGAHAVFFLPEGSGTSWS